jgi:hypothetical protein
VCAPRLEVPHLVDLLPVEREAHLGSTCRRGKGKQHVRVRQASGPLQTASRIGVASVKVVYYG